MSQSEDPSFAHLNTSGMDHAAASTMLRQPYETTMESVWGLHFAVMRTVSSVFCQSTDRKEVCPGTPRKTSTLSTWALQSHKVLMSTFKLVLQILHSKPSLSRQILWFSSSSLGQRELDSPQPAFVAACSYIQTVCSDPVPCFPTTT